MLIIRCPYCGPRNDAEFVVGGEAHVVRPDFSATDAEWGAYQYFRNNTRGEQAERWFHAHGCRQWFNVVRDTVTHRILRVYAMSDAPESQA